MFQRIGQEQESRIHAVDVACSTDAAHLLSWKRNSWLAPYLPEDVAKHVAPEHADPDGMYDSQHAELEELRMRGIFHSDAEGRYLIRTTRPVHYQIPLPRPIGTLRKSLRSYPWRQTN